MGKKKNRNRVETDKANSGFSMNDPNGSYTGRAKDKKKPVQDVDDL